MKQYIKRKEFIGIVLLLASITIFSILFLLNQEQPAGGEKTIAVTVIHGDGSENYFRYDTDALYLGELLLLEGLAKGSQSPYGLFIAAVDGEAAREDKQEWWCITKGGETVMTGADMVVLGDGDAYELTLMAGY